MTFFFTYVFIFMAFLRPQEWLVPWLYGWPVLDVVVWMGILALLLEVNEGRVRLSIRQPQIYLLAGLWVVSILSNVVRGHSEMVVPVSQDMFKLMFFTLLLYAVADRPSRLRAIAIAFVALACLMAVNSILQSKRGYGLTPHMWPIYQPAYATRPAMFRTKFVGIFDDPNDLAQFFVTAIPLAFAIPKRGSPVGYLGASAVAVFLYQAYLTTGSRGGAVAMIATASVLAALWFLPRRWIPFAVGAGLVMALVLCGTLSGRFLDEATRDRVQFWGWANWQFKWHPIIGMGHGRFILTEGRAVHNAFVECYAEMGIVGYWLWFSLLQLGVVGAWRAHRLLKGQSRDERYLRRSIAMWLAALAGFATSAYFLSRTFAYPFLFLIAVTNAIPRIAGRFVDVQADEDRAASVFVNPARDLLVWCTIGSVASIAYIYVSILLFNKAVYG